MRSRTPVNDYRMVMHIWLNFLLPDLKKKKKDILHRIITRCLKILLHTRIARFSYRKYWSLYNLRPQGKGHASVLLIEE